MARPAFGPVRAQEATPDQICPLALTVTLSPGLTLNPRIDESSSRAIKDLEPPLDNVLALRRQGLGVLRSKPHVGEGTICDVPTGEGDGSARVLECEGKAIRVYLRRLLMGSAISWNRFWVPGTPIV